MLLHVCARVCAYVWSGVREDERACVALYIFYFVSVYDHNYLSHSLPILKSVHRRPTKFVLLARLIRALSTVSNLPQIITHRIPCEARKEQEGEEGDAFPDSYHSC